MQSFCCQTGRLSLLSCCRGRPTALWGLPAPASPLSAPSPRPPHVGRHHRLPNQITRLPLFWPEMLTTTRPTQAMDCLQQQIDRTTRMQPTATRKPAAKGQMLQMMPKAMHPKPAPVKKTPRQNHCQGQGRMLSMAPDRPVALPRHHRGPLMALAL